MRSEVDEGELWPPDEADNPEAFRTIDPSPERRLWRIAKVREKALLYSVWRATSDLLPVEKVEDIKPPTTCSYYPDSVKTGILSGPQKLEDDEQVWLGV